MVPDNAVAIDLKAGTARFQLNLPISDYQNFVNSVGDLNPPLPLIPSHVSFDVRWAAKPGAKLTPITDPTNAFTGEFIDSTASIRWSGRQHGFALTSSSPLNHGLRRDRRGAKRPVLLTLSWSASEAGHSAGPRSRNTWLPATRRSTPLVEFTGPKVDLLAQWQIRVSVGAPPGPAFPT
jgi:hypothetical protein